MSEDSIASDPICYRIEANAPLLPPRKRLLAGLKQNGWSSPSSSSCAPAAFEPPQATETLALASLPKATDVDQSSGDAADGGSLQSLNDRGSLQSLNGAAESLDSHSEGQRKPKRQRASSSPTTKLSSKKKKKKSASPGGGEHLLDICVDAAKTCLIVDKTIVSEGVASKITLEVEEHSVALVEGEVLVDGKEERATTANGEASSGQVTNLKFGSESGSAHKEEEEDEVTCTDASKLNTNLVRKAKLDRKKAAKGDDSKNRRKMYSRQKQSKDLEAEQKKLEMQQDKVARMPLPLADEELARQLHRAMNSSPRIARCLSPKEERPLLSSSQKRFSGS